MTETSTWLDSFIAAAGTMPTENLAVLSMALVALAVIWRNP